MRLADLQPPITIEYSRHLDNRGSLVKTVRIIEKKGRNLLTEEGDWLWWPTVNYYGDARIVREQLTDGSTNED